MLDENRAAHARVTSAIDPFSLPFFDDPYPHHAAMRDAAPVVWLERYGIWGMARHAEVHAALNDWQTFSSASGAGLDDFTKTKPWRPPSIILEADPPTHTRSRTAMARVMSPGVMKAIRPQFMAKAEEVVEGLVARGTFDAIPDLAESYPLSVFPDAVGLVKEGRENLLPYGNMAFNAFGPRNALLQAAFQKAAPVAKWIVEQCSRAALTKDGWGAGIYAAADTGEITEEEAGLLVRSMLTAGVDTTVSGLGAAIYAFATHPDEWAKVLAEPALLRPCFDEVLRWESPVQTFFRTTTKASDLGGAPIIAGQKVLLFLASANRDPRRWDNPDRFDVTRKATGHVAFGAGIHGCVGQALARLEAECVLGALAKRVKRIELVGEPVRKYNNSLRSFGSLPVRVTLH